MGLCKVTSVASLARAGHGIIRGRGLPSSGLEHRARDQRILGPPLTPLTLGQRILAVDLASLWRPSVAAYLEGRTFATGTDVARAVGRSYASMSVADWRTLAAVVISCGWRKAKVDGVQVWQAPAEPQLSL
jgi:hypothetical protein